MALRSSLRTAKSIASYASVKVSPVLTRSMAGLSGSVIELSSYLEKTLDARRELTAERAALQTKLRRITNAASFEDSAISEDFLQLSITRYNDVIRAYGELINAARQQLIAETPSYFSPMTQPSTSGRLLEKRDLLFIALALALGGMLAVIAALIWPQES